MTTLHDLVARLEDTWLDPSRAGVGEVAALLEERQRILTAIQNADTQALDPETRQALRERVRAVYERDQHLRVALENRREELEKELGGVVRARGAVRGYGGEPAARHGKLDTEA